MSISWEYSDFEITDLFSATQYLANIDQTKVVSVTFLAIQVKQ